MSQRKERGLFHERGMITIMDPQHPDGEFRSTAMNTPIRKSLAHSMSHKQAETGCLELGKRLYRS